MINAVVDVAGTLPVIGLVATLGRSVIKIVGGARNIYQRALDQRKGSLYEIETMDARTLRGNLPLLFAQDVNAQLDDGVMLHLFIDTYEKLVSLAEGEQGAHSAICNDSWLYGRDGLIRNLGNAVFAIACREKLHWPESSEFWAEDGRLEAHLTDHLSEEDSGGFLKSCGVAPELFHALYELTDGQPVYLDLCVDQYYDVLDAGREPAPEDFGKNVETLVERHSRYIPEHQRDALYLMAGMRRWNKELFDVAASAAGISINPSEYSKRLTRLSYVTEELDGTCAMHQVVAKILSSKLLPDIARPASIALAKYAREQAESTQAQDGAAPADSAQAQSCAELAVEAAANLAGENAPTAELAQALAAQAERAEKSLQYQQALELRQRAAEICRAALGEEHPDTLTALHKLANSYDILGEYQRVRELTEQVYEARKRVLGEEDPDTLRAFGDLALSYIKLGKRRHAMELQEQVYETCNHVLSDEHPDTLRALNNLAGTYSELGEYRRALELQEQVYEARKRVLGDEHPDTLIALNNLAGSYSELGEYQRAKELQEQVYEASKGVLGDEHPDTLTALNNLAGSYRDLGEYQRAKELRELAYEMYKRVQGEEHPATLTALNNLASSYCEFGEYQRAREMLERVYETRKRVLGEEHPDTLFALQNLATVYGDLGEYRSARKTLLCVHEIYKRKLGEAHPKTLFVLFNLARTTAMLGDFNRALRLAERAYMMRKQVLSERHPDTLEARDFLNLLRNPRRFTRR